MIEPLSVALSFGLLLYVLVAACHHIAWWAARTPGSGYLILSVFALFVLTRSLP